MGLSGEIQGTEQVGPQICKLRRLTTPVLQGCGRRGSRVTRPLPVSRRMGSKKGPVVLGGEWSRLPFPSQLSLENQLCAYHEVKETFESLGARPRLLKRMELSPSSCFWSTLHHSLAFAWQQVLDKC